MEKQRAALATALASVLLGAADPKLAMEVCMLLRALVRWRAGRRAIIPGLPHHWGGGALLFQS
jgi:hypothetical protein